MKTEKVLSIAICIFLIALILPATLQPVKAQVPAQVQAQEPPFFKMYITGFNYPETRVAFSAVIASSLREIGIDTTLLYMMESDLAERYKYSEAAKRGGTYIEGGFDVFTMGSGLAPVYDFRGEYHTDYIWPKGGNYGRWSNKDADRLMDEMSITFDNDKRLELLKEWQSVFYDDMPKPVIAFSLSPYAINPKLEGFDPYLKMRSYEHAAEWSTPTGVATMAFPVMPRLFNPIQMWLGFDQVLTCHLYNTLITYDEDLNPAPNLVTDWKMIEGPNGPDTRWVINLRKDVKWHDGWPFNATDVYFTWQSILEKDVGACGYELFKNLMGTKDAIKITGPYQITVDLLKPNAYFASDVLFASDMMISPPIPWHLFKDIPYEEWLNHPYTTAEKPYEVTLNDGTKKMWTGPIGTGPFQFFEYDRTRNILHFKRNENYWGTKAKITDLYIVALESSDPAVAALKSGEVDVIHCRLLSPGKVGIIDPSWGKIVMSPAIDFYITFTLNLDHPVWGTGVDTPLGKQDPARAEEAARYIRHAINHAIPKEHIKNSIFLGFAELTETPVPSEFPGFNLDIPKTEYNITLAKEYMMKAGYLYPGMPTPTPPEPTPPEPTPPEPLAGPTGPPGPPGPTGPTGPEAPISYTAISILLSIVAIIIATYVLTKKPS